VAELNHLIERALVLAIVTAPVAVLVLILSSAMARLFGDPIAQPSDRVDPERITEEDPPPRWHPELARRHRPATDVRLPAVSIGRNGGHVA
jgi:hypothetical protein